jgi:hypothetical protein
MSCSSTVGPDVILIHRRTLRFTPGSEEHAGILCGRAYGAGGAPRALRAPPPRTATAPEVRELDIDLLPTTPGSVLERDACTLLEEDR